MMGSEDAPASHQHPTADSQSLSLSPVNTNPLSFSAVSSRSSSPAASAFLDPPSYSDVVFSPYAPSNGDASPVSPSPPLFGDYVLISVTDPATKTETPLVSGSSGATYVTYLITSMEREGGLEYSVRRRFRDFVTLADRLAEAYRGFVVPLRPDKNTVESQVMQKGEFVERRRIALEKYLRQLAVHPVIGRSDELKVFLQASGNLPLPTSTDVASRMLDGAARLPRQLLGDGLASGYVMQPQEAVQPAKGGRDLLRIFKEIKQSVVSDWGGVKPPLMEEDMEFLTKKEKMQGFELQLSSTSELAEQLVKAQQDMGETMGELGLAFIKLTKLETEEGAYEAQTVRATDCKRMATAAVKASRLYRELNTETVKHLDTLHEHLGIMLSIHNAFSDRASALLTVQTLMSDLSALETRAEKLEAASLKVFGGDRSRLRKVEELKETIRATGDAKTCALREYERIKENNRSELERLDHQRSGDLLGMLKGFVLSQAAYFEKIGSVWGAFADETNGYAQPVRGGM